MTTTTGFETNGGFDVRDMSDASLAVFAARSFAMPDVHDLAVAKAEQARRAARSAAFHGETASRPSCPLTVAIVNAKQAWRAAVVAVELSGYAERLS